MMKAADIIQNALLERRKTQKSLAEELGIDYQYFGKKLKNDTISARVFFDAIDILGLTASFHDKTTGAEIRERREFIPGVIPRLSIVVDGVRYDTGKADALCHTEISSGWVMELYKDYRGLFFVAIWSDWDGAKPSVSPCGESDALRLYTAHGDMDGEPPEDIFKRA